jgi:two-component system response regulator AtoC
VAKKVECRLLVLGQALPPELAASPLVTETELWPMAKLGELLKSNAAPDWDGLVLIHDPPRGDALAALDKLSKAKFELPVVVLDAQPAVEHATQCLRAGAVDYLSLPTKAEDLAAAIERIRQLGRRAAETELLRRTVERAYTSFEDVIGASPPMRKVFDTVERVAGSNVDVLILGPTGTGKELIARAIHRRSPRANKPLCRSIAARFRII